MRRVSFHVQSVRLTRGLRQLGRDQRGNVLVIVAAATVPMLAIVGGGIDMGRGYMSRTRLQQACDAGVLAARKRLGSSAIVGKTVPKDATDTGNRFFKLNFQDYSYGTKTKPVFKMTLDTDFSIAGTASVDVPTTVMDMFGVETLPVSVECSSQFNYSNTDIMMVLDTTGSMSGTVSGASKITTLRKVVKDFYDTVEKSKTDGIRVRYGFVPYATNVNVGYLLQSRWMADTWDYEGREPNKDRSKWIYDSYEVKTPDWGSGDSAVPYKGGNGNSKTKQKMAGSSPKDAEALPIEFEGCIEERGTYNIDDYDDVDLEKARDLDIDAIPDPKKPDTQWKPWIRAVAWLRGTKDPVETGNKLSTSSGDNLSCPSQAHKLSEMTAAEVAAYVDGLKVGGTTYHDIGLIWGARLISPSGLFAGENVDVRGRPTMRHLIFLTDGETNAQGNTYGAYGIEPSSQRRWAPGGKYTLNQTVENRFTFVCSALKNKNVTVWVIGFGTKMTPMLKNCAGNGHWFQADNAADLSAAFATIASAIGDLRITK